MEDIVYANLILLAILLILLILLTMCYLCTNGEYHFTSIISRMRSQYNNGIDVEQQREQQSIPPPPMYIRGHPYPSHGLG